MTSFFVFTNCSNIRASLEILKHLRSIKTNATICFYNSGLFRNISPILKY